jgi:hypothetical protein
LVSLGLSSEFGHFFKGDEVESREGPSTKRVKQSDIIDEEVPQHETSRPSSSLLTISTDIILKHVSCYFGVEDFINLHRRTCKALLVGPDLPECLDLDILWEMAIKGNRPSVIL